MEPPNRWLEVRRQPIGPEVDQHVFPALAVGDDIVMRRRRGVGREVDLAAGEQRERDLGAI
jgi:hypothetical protein